MIDQTDHIEELLSKVDQLSVELDQTRKELTQAISERTPHDYGLLKYTIESLKQELHEARTEVERLKGDVANQMEINHAVVAMKVPTRLEPSRLEIAAMLLGAQPPPQAGSFSGQAEHALRRADALIAAAKEVAK